MTQEIFKKSLIVFAALGFMDHDLSLEGGGVEMVTFERRAQNPRQLPDYPRFAGRLVLVD